jgi:hypothetical protein
LVPAYAAIGLSIVVFAVVLSSMGNGSHGPRSGNPEVLSTPQIAPSAPGVAGSTAGPAQGEFVAPGTGLPPTPVPPIGTRPRNGLPQIQEHSASLNLSTDADKLQGAANGVVDVADRYTGFVDSSDMRAGGSLGHASFALRIPTAHLQEALADLSGLGHVTLLNQGSVNVTDAYVSAGKAYADSRAKVDALLADLRSPSSPSEAASIRQQLVVARQELAAARVGLRGVKQRVALTPVSVEITAQGDGSWSIGDAADEAGKVLEAIGGATLIALAVLVPLGALTALGWAGSRELRRRRREAPLDR